MLRLSSLIAGVLTPLALARGVAAQVFDVSVRVDDPGLPGLPGLPVTGMAVAMLAGLGTVLLALGLLLLRAVKRTASNDGRT